VDTRRLHKDDGVSDGAQPQQLLTGALIVFLDAFLRLKELVCGGLSLEDFVELHHVTPHSHLHEQGPAVFVEENAASDPEVVKETEQPVFDQFVLQCHDGVVEFTQLGLSTFGVHVLWTQKVPKAFGEVTSFWVTF
jgi:hypothetical protein